MIEPIATGTWPAEAPASLARVEQLQALAAKASEATSPAAQESFAAALQAASEPSSAAAEPGMQPEPIPVAEVEPMPSIEAEGIPGAEAEAMSAAAAAVATAAYGAGTAGYYADAAQAPGVPSTAPTGIASSPAGTMSPPAADYRPAAPTGAAPYEASIQQAATRNGVEPALLKGLIEQESGFDPNAHSSAGALGLTQLMPSTAASLGVSEPLDPAQSIEGGARLLGQLLRQFGGNVSYALAAYNAGAGAVHRYGGIPPYPETEAYVSKVLANARAYQGQMA